MIRKRLYISLCASSLLFNAHLYAADTLIEMDAATVQADIINEELSVNSLNIISNDKIEIFSSPELLNPYKAIELMPGVDIRANDPFGMSITHKIRGKSDRNIGETLEGLPLKGIGPGVGLSTMVDMENIETVSVEKGPIKADSGLGYGSDNGMVNMKMKRPSKEFGSTLKQTLGTQNFSKTYLRVDSGETAGIAKVFVSASLAKADKFKGEGESPNRQNFEIGIASTSNQKVEWELYGIYNKSKEHKYKGLTYQQSQDLSKYKDLDYQTTNPNSSDYYDFNKQDFDTYTLFGKVKVPLSVDSSILFKPYFLNDSGHSYFTSGSNVMDWLVDHNTYGAVLEYALKMESSKVKIGYWYQEDEPPGPPTSRKIRDTNLKFIKWERIIGVEKNHTFSAPYLTYEKRFNNTLFEAGLKYLWLSSPSLVSYSTTGIGDVSYKEALSQVNSVNFTLNSNTYELFLPNLGVTHYFNDTSSLKMSYGKNYNTPNYGFGGSMISYFSKPTVDQQVLQNMWSNLKPEESNNFDLSYSYETGDALISSTLFYSLVENVGGNLYDPILNMNYQQNTAKARSYGVELGGGYKLLNNLTTNISFTYTNYAFTSDIQSAAGSFIKSKGNQLPDVPKFMGNISALYEKNGYKIAPVVRYLGKRYVDVENKYSIKEHYLVDLTLDKEIVLNEKHKFNLSVSATNLLNEEYISTVSTSETNVAEVGPTYIVGAPRAIFASLQYKY